MRCAGADLRGPLDRPSTEIRHGQFPGVSPGRLRTVGEREANRFGGEEGGIVIDAHAHPTLVLADVIHAVGDGLAKLGVNEVVYLDFLRFALGSPLATGVLQRPERFFLLGIH